MSRKDLESFIQKRKGTLTTEDQNFIEAILTESFQYRALRGVKSGHYTSHVSIGGQPIGEYDAPKFFRYALKNQFVFKREFLAIAEVQEFLRRNLDGLAYHASYLLRQSPIRKHYIGNDVMLQTMLMSAVCLEGVTKDKYGYKSFSDYEQFYIRSVQDFYQRIVQMFLNRFTYDSNPVTPELVNTFFDNYVEYLESTNSLTPQLSTEIQTERDKALKRIDQVVLDKQQEDARRQRAQEQYQEQLALENKINNSGLKQLVDSLEALSLEVVNNTQYDAKLVAKVAPVKTKLLEQIEQDFEIYTLLDSDDKEIIKNILSFETARFFKSRDGVTNSMKGLAEIIEHHQQAATSSSTSSYTPS